MNGSANGSENCRERYGAWGSLKDGRLICYYAGIFVLVFGRKYAEKWKKDFMERMWRKIIMETDTALKEKGMVGNNEWDSGRGRKREIRKDAETGIVPPDGGMF